MTEYTTETGFKPGKYRIESQRYPGKSLPLKLIPDKNNGRMIEYDPTKQYTLSQEEKQKILAGEWHEVGNGERTLHVPGISKFLSYGVEEIRRGLDLGDSWAEFHIRSIWYRVILAL